jgi:hypothetical protein
LLSIGRTKDDANTAADAKARRDKDTAGGGGVVSDDADATTVVIAREFIRARQRTRGVPRRRVSRARRRESPHGVVAVTADASIVVDARIKDMVSVVKKCG